MGNVSLVTYSANKQMRRSTPHFQPSMRCTSAILLLTILVSQPLYGQLPAAGDTLILTFQGADRLATYRELPGDEKEHTGYVTKEKNGGDTLIVLGEWGNLHAEVVVAGDTMITGHASITRVAERPEAIAEREAQIAKEIEEGRRRDEERATWEANLVEAGIPLIIHGLSFNVNSAGGVEPRIDVENISERRLKYVTLEVVGVNPVGDPVTGTVSGKQSHALPLVGPIEPGERSFYSYEGDPPFYARTTDCIEVTRVEIEFMDGGRFVMVNDLRDARWGFRNYRLEGECRNR